MVDVKIHDLSAAGSVTGSMQFETDLSGVTANKVTATQIKTFVLDSLDHGTLSGLGDDDHSLYALADGTRWTTTPTASRVTVSDGSGNLVVSSTTTTQLSYLDATSSIQTQLDNKFDAASDVDHDSTTNFVANEHVNHTGVTLTAGIGLSGGGDISSNRSFSLDLVSLTEDVSPVGSTDFLVTYDDSAATYKKVLPDNLGFASSTHDHDSDYAALLHTHATSDITSGTFDNARISQTSVTQHEASINHDALSQFVANEHIDHSSVTLTAGTGITGGGTIEASRSFNLATNTLTDEASPTSSDTFPFYDTTAAAMRRTDGSNLADVHNHDTDYSPLLLEETSEKTTSYTLALADLNKVVLMNGSSLTLTVPTNASVAFSTGSVVNVYNANASALTIEGDVGVTVRNTGDLAQYGEVSLRKRGTNEWVLAGTVT